jgi:phospholipase A1
MHHPIRDSRRAALRIASPGAALLASILLTTPSHAQTPNQPAPTLEKCAEIGAAPDRLACYDALAGRAPAPQVPPAQDTSVGIAKPAPPAPSASNVPPSTSLLAAKGAPLPDVEARPTSLLSKYWELEPEDKRGIFNFVGYQPNYVLPMHLTSRINKAPGSPTQAPVEEPDYRREEAKFQLSLRTKLAQDVLLPGGDLWVAFTQQAFWQIYNGADSKPFRNTDYQPEMMYVLPTGKSLRELPGGIQWRYTQLGLAHQSNGQSDPLSRSWNRVYLAAGFERGDWSLITRITKRLNEPLASDNNPDLMQYRGRGELQLNWAHERQTVSLQIRSSFNTVHYGSAQLEWSYPVFRDQPNGLRYFVQAFTGYGETLTDYNFRQTSIGAGFTFLQF